MNNLVTLIYIVDTMVTQATTFKNSTLKFSYCFHKYIRVNAVSVVKTCLDVRVLKSFHVLYMSPNPTQPKIEKSRKSRFTRMAWENLLGLIKQFECEEGMERLLQELCRFGLIRSTSL